MTACRWAGIQVWSILCTSSLYIRPDGRLFGSHASIEPSLIQSYPANYCNTRSIRLIASSKQLNEGRLLFMARCRVYHCERSWQESLFHFSKSKNQEAAKKFLHIRGLLTTWGAGWHLLYDHHPEGLIYKAEYERSLSSLFLFFRPCRANDLPT